MIRYGCNRYQDNKGKKLTLLLSYLINKTQVKTQVPVALKNNTVKTLYKNRDKLDYCLITDQQKILKQNIVNYLIKYIISSKQIYF